MFTRGSSWFCFKHLLLLSGQSRLRWKPPVISHRTQSCWSSSGSSTASHCCNLQINIYGSACSGGLSGSRPSGKIEEWAWLCSSTTLPVCFGLSLAGRAKQKCAWFHHRENKIEMHCALCLWKLPSVNTWAAPGFSFCETQAEADVLLSNYKTICIWRTLHDQHIYYELL